jgi:hypothetical protein
MVCCPQLILLCEPFLDVIHVPIVLLDVCFCFSLVAGMHADGLPQVLYGSISYFLGYGCKLHTSKMRPLCPVREDQNHSKLILPVSLARLSGLEYSFSGIGMPELSSFFHAAVAF